jgi:ketosteroid isomerase-like protein
MAEETAASLAERIDALEARAAIADLIHDYARCIRRDEPEKVAALFTPDGVFEIRDGHPDRPGHTVRSRLEGAAAIDAYLAPGKGKPHPIPLIRNLMIEVAGDSAAANSVMDARIFGTDHAVSGEYHDRFRRVGGRWLFASRTFTMFGGPAT